MGKKNSKHINGNLVVNGTLAADKIIGLSGGTPSLDHGDLTGLSDDDHTQYSRVDGTRAFTSPIGGVSPTLDSHLITRGWANSAYAASGNYLTEAVADTLYQLSGTYPTHNHDSRYIRRDIDDSINNIITIEKSGELMHWGGGGLVSNDDCWIRMGNGTGNYEWYLKYIGSTGGQDGNELRFESTLTGKYWQMDHLGNFEYYNGSTTTPILTEDAGDARYPLIADVAKAGDYTTDWIATNGNNVIDSNRLRLIGNFYEYTNTTGWFKIKTNIPWEHSSFMGTIILHGFRYSGSEPNKLASGGWTAVLGSYLYSSTGDDATAEQIRPYCYTNGCYSPDIYMSEEGGKVMLGFSGIQGNGFQVSILVGDYTASATTYYNDWEFVDEVLSGNHIVQYEHNQLMTGTTKISGTVHLYGVETLEGAGVDSVLNNYVEVAGDTMTGDLTMNGGNILLANQNIQYISGPVRIGDSTTGSTCDDGNNVYIGKAAGENVASGNTNHVMIGQSAGRHQSGAAYGAVAIGYYALNSGMAQSATAVGFFAGAYNTGDYVTAYGYQAAENNTGGYSTLLGHTAGHDNTGDYTTAVGYQAGYSNTANNNVFVGYRAGYNNTGATLVGIGINALLNNTQDRAVAVGTNAGLNPGAYFTAIGYNAGENSPSDRGNCTFIGCFAGQNADAANITAVGRNAAEAAVGATYLTAIGMGAGENCKDTNCTHIGYYAGNALTESACTTVGANAGQLASSGYLTALGYSAGISHKGYVGTCIGINAGLQASGDYGTFLGYAAGHSSYSEYGIHIGYQAGYNDAGGNTVAVGMQAAFNNNNSNCVFVGRRAGYNNSAYAVTSVGFEAGKENTAGGACLVGFYAGQNNTGGNLVAIGREAGQNNTGTQSVLIGYQAGQNNEQAGVTAVGYLAGQVNASNGYSTFLGFYAGNNSTGGLNTGVGANALENNTGARTVALGRNAGRCNTGAECLLLGHSAGENNTQDNQLVIGNLNNPSGLIRGDFSEGWIYVDEVRTSGLRAPGEKSLSIEQPLAGDSVTLWKTDKDLVITEVCAVILGSGSPAVSGNLYFDTNRSAASPSSLWASVPEVNSSGTGHVWDSFSDATVPSGSWIWFEVDGVAGTVDEVHYTVRYQG